MKIVPPNVYKEFEIAKEMFMTQFAKKKRGAQYGIHKVGSTMQTQGPGAWEKVFLKYQPLLGLWLLGEMLFFPLQIVFNFVFIL